ncbi:unnamed protein product, partial [Durusdinium trenchii]
MEGGAHWLVLDSWATAAAVTLPSMSLHNRILSFLLPGPGLQYHGNSISHAMTRSIRDETMASSGLLLRTWQNSFLEDKPRLQLVGLSAGWRQDSLPRLNATCRGSWMAKHFDRGKLMNMVVEQSIRMMKLAVFEFVANLLEG